VAYPLGVVDIVFAPLDVPAAAQRAADLGFDHLDVPLDWEGSLAVPVGDRIAFPSARPGGSTPAPPKGEGMWDRAVGAFRRAPGSRIEPWPGSIVDSVEAVRAFLDEVPGLRLLVDTGHVACWGEDPVELLEWADHVQLRQAREGVPQALDGDVDFAAVLRRLDDLGYEGRLSIEYFDLPDFGWPLDDPVAHAVALAEEVRAHF
jgi:sugar phosphate isomerase/epimerase